MVHSINYTCMNRKIKNEKDSIINLKMLSVSNNISTTTKCCNWTAVIGHQSDCMPIKYNITNRHWKSQSELRILL